MNRRYLLRGRSWHEMRELARGLEHFRFVRAVGGHANDGDYLCAALCHDGGDDLTALLGELGVEEPPGGSGRVAIAGAEIYLSVRADRAEIHLGGRGGDPYQVGDADVRAARSVEASLTPLLDRLIDPPVESPRCVSPSTWPEFFEEADSPR